MTTNTEENTRKNIIEFLIRFGDDRLILGHRLSEWCGHAPILEEDIALANIALDCIGQASSLLKLAVEIEGENRSEDDLAYLRNEREFKNIQLVEQPNEDFAYTIVRQFFYDTFAVLYLEKLQNSSLEDLAGIAAKSLKESKYHFRHSKEWMLRLGDGTEFSNQKVQSAVNDLWQFTDELFYEDEINTQLIEAGIIFPADEIKTEWIKIINEIFSRAKILLPRDGGMIYGGRNGIHSEYLGHLLAEMQIVARSYPNAKW
ncbi:MAG: phenylacetate-CoA oxygenase subunit PaaC [Melioribacteraceae bacterium]|nr:phenylacetate-CoA oxygenase subunit PaaC [Melioribacteraceae bacterium]MCF8354887.1 phenylacetate-CoA oxygenase subunit PaaC [Melioribacteraceae bacterium]MCF8393891.1 phenylacetate-CoA oxygenase subunit PaaC [Melioribacteraceae bacterium]MCF8419663.1 phenylacetate-CoA oxygenase subunit PaaC [Melioribacteraceae bacterium]